MDDQRMIRRATLCGKDRSNRGPILSICGKTIDRFRRQRDQSA
jgi:hypothetical protein